MIPTGPTTDRRYVGGSTIAAIAGLDPWSTKLDVWAGLTGRRRRIETEQMAFGSAFERPILEVDSRFRGVTHTFPGTLIDPKNPHRGATPDGIEDNTYDVQVKLVGAHMLHHWGEEWAGPNGVPEYVYLQVQWEMHHVREVLGIRCPAARVIMVSGTTPKRYLVPWDPDTVESLIVMCDRFWTDHIERDVMPVVTEADAEVLRALHPRELRGMQPSTPEVESLARKHAELGQHLSRLKGERDAVGNKLCALIGESAGFEGPWGKATWRSQKGRVSWVNLAKELGPSQEQIESHRGEESRRLSVKVHGFDEATEEAA